MPIQNDLRPSVIQTPHTPAESEGHSHNRILQLAADLTELLWHHNARTEFGIGVFRAGDALLHNTPDEHYYRNGLIDVGVEVGIAGWALRFLTRPGVAVAELTTHGAAAASETLLPTWDEIDAMHASASPRVQVLAQKASDCKYALEAFAAPGRIIEQISTSIKHALAPIDEHRQYLQYAREQWHAEVRNGTFPSNTPWHPPLTKEEWRATRNRQETGLQPLEEHPRHSLPTPNTPVNTISQNQTTGNTHQASQERTPRISAPQPPLPTATSPHYQLRVDGPTLHVPLDNLRAATPGISTTILRNGVPLANVSGSINFQDLSRSQINTTIPVGDNGAYVGATPDLRHPLQDSRVSVSPVPGLTFSTTLGHPFSNLVVGIGPLSVPVKRISQARLTVGIPGVKWASASVSVREIQKPIEKTVKKISEALGFRKKRKEVVNTGYGITGLPWFIPEFDRGGGTEKLEPTGLNQRWVDLNNKANALLGELQAISTQYNYSNILSPFICQATSLETQVQQSFNTPLSEQIALAKQVDLFLGANQATLRQWSDFCQAMNAHQDKVVALYKEVGAERHLLSSVLHSYDFTYSPELRQTYFKHHDLFYVIEDNLSNEMGCISNAAQHSARLANLLNYQDTSHGLALTALKNDVSTLYPHLQEIYEHHGYREQLLPFILKVEEFEAEVQRSWGQTQRARKELARRIQEFFTENNVTLQNWCTFYSDWNTHCDAVHSLYETASQMTKNLSSVLHTFDFRDQDALKQFYFRNYQSFYELQGIISNHFEVARNGNQVTKNNEKFNNLLDFLKKEIVNTGYGITGLPRFIPEFDRGGGTEKLEPTAGLNQRWVILNNKANALLSELQAISAQYNYSNILFPFICQATSLETQVQQSFNTPLSEQIALAKQVDLFLGSNQATLRQWSDFCQAMNAHQDKVMALYKEVDAERRLLSSVLHSYDFTCSPEFRQTYFKHHDLFYVIENNLSNEMGCISNAAQHSSRLANLLNYQDTSHGLALTALHNDASMLYPHLQEIYEHHRYQEQLLPFILKVEEFEADVQRSWGQTQAVREELALRIQEFFTENNVTLQNWCTFYSDWNTHCDAVHSLYEAASQMTKNLSSVLHTFDFRDQDALKQFYFKNYQSFYELQGTISKHFEVARNGNQVAKNNVKFNNLLAFLKTAFNPSVRV